MTHPLVSSRRGQFSLLTAILAGFSFGCGRTASVPEEEPPVAPVKVAAAAKVSLAEWTELVGSTQPLPGRAARITAAVEGRVLWVLGNGKGMAVVEGQHVDAGQVIVQLDDRVAQANREKVRAGQDELIEQKKQADVAVSLAKIEVDRLEELKREEMKRAGTPASICPRPTWPWMMPSRSRGASRPSRPPARRN